MFRKALSIMIVVSVVSDQCQSDDILYSYDGNIHPLDDGWEAFNLCDPPCSDWVENGIYFRKWTNGVDQVNYNYWIAPVGEPVPPTLWVEWHFRSSCPIGQIFCSGDGGFGVQYDRLSANVSMFGDTAVSFSCDDVVRGLDINEFHTYRFESLDGLLYRIAVDGQVFTGGIGSSHQIATVLQMRGAGGCETPQNVVNEWDFVRYGTIASLPLSPDYPVTVLFDAFYLCAHVVRAVENKGWHYIGVAKSNRRLKVEGGLRGGHRLRPYASNVLRRSGKETRIAGLRRTQRYRVAQRVGTMKKLGTVKVVFSRRRGDDAVIALVTNDLKRSPGRVVGDYLRRWSIEMLIKDQKQHLGLGAYRVLRYRAVVRHLHLVDCAYACLTHVGLWAQRAQGRQDAKNVLHLPPIRQLKEDLRQKVWNEAIKDVVRASHERAVIRRLEKLLAA